MSSEITKNKKKFPIGLIICLAVVLICAGVTVATLILRNVSSSKPIEIVEQMEASDETTLRQILAANGTCTVKLINDVVVSEELDVNGTKTIVGNKSIIMDTFNIGTTESVCAVQTGAKLTLDGVTIDGNGVVNGIAVKSGGELKCLSGDVVYGYPYGLTIAGLANIEDISVTDAMHTGIYVEYGGEAHMNGGVVKDNLYGIAVASQASMTIGGDSVVTESNGILINNYGKLDITGGKFTVAFDNAITNQGEMTIKGSADKMVEIGDVGRSAIVSKKNSKLTVEYLYMHDLGFHGIDVEKDSEGDIRNSVAKNAGRSCFYVNNSKVVMKDVEISDCQSYAIYGTKNSDVALENITVKVVENRGIVNDGAKMTAKGIVIENTKKNAFHTMGEGAVTKIEDLKVITPNSNAIAAVTGGNVNAKNVTIEEPKNEGLIVDADSKIEIENVTINKSGMTSVANNGGTLAARNITIISPKNIGIKTTDAGTSAVRGATITGTANHALAVEKGSSLTISDCKMEKIGWEKEKAAVYVSKSKMIMKNTQITNVPSYGIYVTDGEKASDKATHLENVTLTKIGTDAKKHRGIANVNSLVNMTDVKVTDAAGAGIYTKGAESVTKMNRIEVTNPGTCGLGVTGGTVQARNITIVKPKNEGVYVAKGATVKNLDNATITDPGAQGINNVGGTIHVTVNKTYNPDNTKENGVTVTNPGTSAIKSVGGTITVRNSTIKNAKNHAFDIEGGSDATVNYCTIDKTGMSAVYVLESKLTMKNTEMDNLPSYGVYVKNSREKDEKGATLENLKINKPGDSGIVSENSKVTVKDATILKSEADGFYAKGADVVMSINGATITDAKGCGIYNNGVGTVTAKNVDIKDVTKYGVYVAKEKGTVNLDNVNIDNVIGDGNERNGIQCAGTLNITAKNEAKNGVKITNVASGNGIYVGAAGVVIADGVNVNNVSKKALNVYGKATVSNFTIAETKEHGIQSAAGAETTVTGYHISKTNTTGSTSAAVYAKESTLTMKDGQIVEAPTHAIYVDKATVDVIETTITNPLSEGIQNIGGTVTADGVTITGAKGCAIWNKEAAVTTVKNSRILDVTKYGIYVESGTTATLDNVTIDNVLGKDRDGINCAGTLNITNSTSANGVTVKNVTQGHGIYINQGKITANKVTVQNTSKNGLYVNGGSEHSVTDITVAGTGTQGMQFASGAGITVNTFNVSDTNKTGSATAIYTSGASNVILKNGTVLAAKSGLYLDGTSQVAATNLIIERTAGNANALVVVKSGTTFTLNEENATSRIDGKSSEGDNYAGRGVEVQGTFIMNGGTICNNKVTGTDSNPAYGAGVLLNAQNAQFNMVGGNIYNNVLAGKSYGGAVALNADNTKFTMSGGTIYSNAAVNAGGAIAVNGTGAQFTLSGGTIGGTSLDSKNTANNGGAIYVGKGSMVMNGGTISFNQAGDNGGAIWLNVTGFTMNGGAMTGNVAANKGGAIYVNCNKCTLTLNAGTISGNSANSTTAGVGQGIHCDKTGSNACALDKEAVFDLQDSYNNKITIK